MLEGTHVNDGGAPMLDGRGLVRGGVVRFATSANASGSRRDCSGSRVRSSRPPMRWSSPIARGPSSTSTLHSKPPQATERRSDRPEPKILKSGVQSRSLIVICGRLFCRGEPFRGDYGQPQEERLIWTTPSRRSRRSRTVKDESLTSSRCSRRSPNGGECRNKRLKSRWLQRCRDGCFRPRRRSYSATTLPGQCFQPRPRVGIILTSCPWLTTPWPSLPPTSRGMASDLPW